MWSIRSIESIENSFFVPLPTGAIPVLFNSGFLFLYFHRLLFPTVAPLCSSTEKRKKGDFSQIFSIFCLTILRAGVYYMTSVRDIAQPGLARLTGGQKVRSSNLRIPTIFLPKWAKKWSTKTQVFSSRFCATKALHSKPKVFFLATA